MTGDCMPSSVLLVTLLPDVVASSSVITVVDVTHMPHCNVPLQATTGEAAVGMTPHKAVHALGVMGAGVGDALPACNRRRRREGQEQDVTNMIGSRSEGQCTVLPDQQRAFRTCVLKLVLM